MSRCIMALLMAAALTVAASLPLTGCSSGGGYTPELKSPTVSSPAIGQDGTLRVGVNTDQSPLAGRGNDKIIGIDVDIAAALADEMGLKLSIVDVGSDPVKALQEGTVDIVMGIDGTDSQTDYWTSDEYLPTAIALFAASSTAPVPTKATSPKIGAQSSSKSAWAVNNEFGAESMRSATNLGDAFNQLSNNTVNYVASDAVIGLYAAHRQGTDASIVALMSKSSGYCIAVKKTNTELQKAVNDALSTLLSNGTIEVIEKKWLGVALDLEDVPLTAGAQAGGSSAEGEGGEGEGTEGDAAKDQGEGQGDGAAGADADAGAAASSSSSASATAAGGAA